MDEGASVAKIARAGFISPMVGVLVLGVIGIFATLIMSAAGSGIVLMLVIGVALIGGAGCLGLVLSLT